MNLVYTAIYNDYDELKEQPPQKDTEFILFSDKRIESETWKVFKTKSTNGFIDSKWWKLHPPTGYDLIIWIDGSITIKEGFVEGIKQRLGDGNYGMQKHPEWDCIDLEYKATITDHRYDGDMVKKQVESYKSEGLPEHNGIPWTCILARKGDTSDFDNRWWEEIEKWGKQDQISSPYLIWKLGYKIKTLDIKDLYSWHHHK